ncbi:hypothetical protein Tco_1030081 [Tanacetum coccineum]|uniref:CCHC-type domain-containing protein n=1 Tax=Tanacetum coccineum TaxID=301880 RepID=A0ABQ5G5L8_9ASTR
MGCGQPCVGFYCYLCTCQQCGFSLNDSTCMNCTYGDGKPVTCCECESPLNGGFCLICASRAGNSSACNPNPNSYNDSPNFSDYTPQPQYETYLCELCGNNSHYGYDCPPRFPLVCEQEPCYNQNYNDNYYSHNSSSFLCCDNYGGPHETFRCQSMNQNFYTNSSGFDQIQPLQFPVINQPPQATSTEMLQTRENLMEAIQAFLKEYDHIPPKEKCMALLLAEERFLKIKQAVKEEHNHLKSTKAITPDLPTEEPDNSLSMGDEHLSIDNRLFRVIKSSFENLVPIPSESEGISDDTCDVPFCDNSPPLDVLKDHFEIFSDSNDDCTSSDDDAFEDINYIEASPPEDSLIMGNEELSTILKKESDEFIKSNVKDLIPIPSESEDTSESDSESSLSDEDVPEDNVKTYSNPLFEFDDEYIHSDINPLFDEVLDDIKCKDSYGDDIDEIDAFLDVDTYTDIEDGYHDSEGDIHYLESLLSDNTTLSLHPNVFLDHDPRTLSNDLKIMVKIFDLGIHETKFSPTYVSLTFKDRRYLSFTYVIRIFLPYFTYPVDSPLLLSTRSEDTIFDPDIST